MIAPPTPISVASIIPSSLGDSSIFSGGDERLQLSLQQSWKPPKTNKENGEDSPKVRALFEKVQQLEQLLSEYMPDKGPGNSNPPESTEPAPPQLRGTLSKTRFFGQSHWMNLVGLFDIIAAPTGTSSIPTHGFSKRIMTTNVPAVMKKCKAIAKSTKFRIFDEWKANPDFRSSIPCPETCEILLDAYFRTTELAFRIFHIPTFRKEYDQYRNQPLLASDSFILRMLLAMAIGVTYYQEPDAETLRTQAKKWIYAAQSWLSEIPYEKSRLNIAGLQLHCLLLIARQSLVVVADLVWISAGSLVRRAFSMGLHRDPKYFPNMSVLQAEIRRRLWATIAELNLQCSVESGMRPLICLDDFDTEAPANINDEDIDENTSIAPVSKPSNVFTQTSIQIILLSSLRTRIEILQVSNTLNSEPSYEEVSRLGEIMNNECRANCSFVRKIRSQKAEPRPTQLQCNVLDLYLRRYILILCSFLATKPQNDPRHYFARKICLDSSVTMVSYASNENGTKQSLKDFPYDDYTCLRTRSGGFFESVIPHSVIIIFHELVTQLKEQDSFIGQSKELRQPLKNILREACELLAVRVSVGKNNVKGHLLFSAALGQIEAIEAGTSVSQGAVDGAKRSAEICSALLADTEPVLAPESEDAQRDGLGFETQDWSMDFVMPDAWLFSAWDGSQGDDWPIP
ncbi:Transcription factor [Lachnellula willkommii]|uniref:Transcription factor n=1 Tax=Lachnellula willkommii TaxID=215461 RepID=A0A559MFX8_9HELO|nr:Transcription factor [Lachnellula willkommii]